MKIFYLFILFCGLISCSDRSATEETVPNEITNLAPSQVKLKIENISSNSADLSWEKATDPENDEVTYTVEVNGQILVQNSTELSLKIQHLDELQNYSGKIIATDSKNNTSETPFTFQTKKYYLTFVKNYLLPNPNPTQSFGGNLLKLSDGNYLFGGYVYLPTGYFVFLTKTDYQGNLLWTKNYNMEGESSPSTFKMKEVNGEIILIASYTVAKLDLEGVIKWKQRITTYDTGYGDSTINSFSADSQNNIYVVGTLADNSYGPIEKGLITKLTKDGNKIWEKEYISHIAETGARTQYLRFIDVDIQDDQIVIFGDVDINSSVSVEQAFYLFKTTLDGNAISEKTFDKVGLAYQFIKRKNGNYLLSSGHNVVEIDKSGNELWRKEIYNSISRPYDIFFSIKETPSGNLLFIGRENSGINVATYFLTDSKANTIWKKYYKDLPNYTAALDAVCENDGSFRIAVDFGRYYSLYTYYEETTLIKTDPEGNF